MVDWKRIYDEFEKLTFEEVEKIRELFRKKPKERLKEYFSKNPYAEKVFKEKLKLRIEVPVKLLPSVPEYCPICGVRLKLMTRVPIMIKDPLKLTAEEEYYRAKEGLPLPIGHIEWVDVPETMKVWQCQVCDALFERDLKGRLIQRTPEYIYRKIIRERAKLEKLIAPPTPTPAPPRVPRKVTLEPPDIAPLDWVKHVKGIDEVTWWKKMTTEERKKILDEYERLCWENVKRRRGMKS